MDSKIKQIEIGKTPKDWGIKKLIAVASFTRGFSYRGSEKSKINGEYVFVTLNSVKEGGGFKKAFSYITTDRVKERHFVNKGDIVIANTEQTKTGTLLGYPALVDFPAEYKKDKGIFSHHITKVTPKSGVDRRFLYYYLIFNQKNAVTYNTGSVIWALDVDNWSNNTAIYLPPLPEQRAIAKILSDLDEKIELNRQMNEILESIAQAIFKHWFVDLNCPINVERKNIGTLPGHWKPDEFGNHIDFIKGKKPVELSESLLDGYGPHILIEYLNGVNSLFANKNGMTWIERNEPIMVMDGASSGRVEIGYEGVLGSTLAKVIKKSDQLSNFYIYHYLKYKESDINSNPTGTSIPHADKEKIKEYICNIPPKPILLSFDTIIDSIMMRIIKNREEVATLIQTRDSLLPKLMLGKIRLVESKPQSLDEHNT